MRFWSGECSRAFTDWRGLHQGVKGGAWLVADFDVAVSEQGFVTAERL
jgi:hypothetical protein